MRKFRHFVLSCVGAALVMGASEQVAWASVIAMTVGDVSTGNYNLTSLSVRRGTEGVFTYEPHQLTNVQVTDVDAFGQQLLVPRGAPLPLAGSRAHVLEDWAVNTGINNITTVNGTPDRSLEVTFTRPVVNSDGPDIILIETGGDDGFRWWINDDRAGQGADQPISAYSSALMFGVPLSTYQYGNGSQSILGLEDLESPTGWSFGSDFSRNLHAMALDLSSVGVPLGGSVTSIRLQSFAGNQRVDPVLIVGLPVVPEPTGLALLGLAAGALMRRRRVAGSMQRTAGSGQRMDKSAIRNPQCAIRNLAMTVMILAVAPAAHASLIVPQYNSYPEATAQLYLDFTGTDHFGRWGIYDVGSVPAYDVDGDPTSFSGIELSYIRQIFIRVAEKFSPFNINVTTVDPGNRDNRVTAHVMIGGRGEWYPNVAGGVAYRGGFYNASSNTAWAFPDNLRGGDPKPVAEVIAHEAGHLFGLTHQSSWSQNAQGQWVRQEYSTNNNNPHKRPVMGSSYDSTRGLWWYGTTTSRTTFQDDLAILTNNNNRFGYREDDHGNTRATATPLTADGWGVIDPVGGVIERVDDMDMFSFVTGTGEVSFWTVLAEYGAMLDSSLWLYDIDGNLLESVATASLAESLTTTLTAGNYFIGVSGAGNYGDLGQYTLMGSIIPLVHTPEPAAAGLLIMVVGLLGRRRTKKAIPV